MHNYEPFTRLELFPISTQIHMVSDREHLAIAGCDLSELAAIYGTPLYLYDQATLSAAASAYYQTLARAYPGDSGLTYAGKAFLCVALAQWMQAQGLYLDCTGAGELAIAAAAGVRRENILVHGVNKRPDDMEAALDQAGTLVVDNLFELNRLVELASRNTGPVPQVWLRLRPGLAVETHAYTQTGQEDSKFGLNLEEAWQAVLTCLRHGLPLTGLHFHQGSHFDDPAPVGAAIETCLDLVSALRDETGWVPKVICPGGGWGVAYHEDELPHPSVERYVEFVAGCLVEGCNRRGLALPHLQFEPGRSLVARAGVAIYRVGVVKHTPQGRWLLLDGGLADNPRPALYGARYSALPVEGPSRNALGPHWLAGPFCESGDILIKALVLPELQPGELVAVPVSGAYQLSMGSNYNGARKPAVLWLENQAARLIQRRESLEDLLRRDLPL